jgi:hypothetical protein
VNGFFGYDIDPRDGGDVHHSALVAEHGAFPRTRCHKTGGGGIHYFFRVPEGKHIPCTQIASGIDIKGDGGYLVVPPSLHASGRRYDMSEGDYPILDAPDWLVDAILKAVPEKQPCQLEKKFADSYGVRLENICIPTNPVVEGHTIKGGHPIHGSTHGYNLHVDVDTQQWYCFRCGVGGGVRTWMIVEWILKRCYEPGDKHPCRTAIEEYRRQRE